MPKYIRNAGKVWSDNQEKSLKQMAKSNTPTRVIGLKLGRTATAVQAKASELKVSLNPHNLPPYNRRKK
jgi:hypothetical protein